MGSRKKSIYVVVNGRKPGIYSEWAGPGKAAEQVEAFPKAIYKGFYTQEEGLNWLKEFSPEALRKLAPNLLEVLNRQSDTSPTLPETVTELLKSGKVVMFVDGSASSVSGAGGFGVILKYKESVKELSGGFRRTTNNRMEIVACIEGLKALKRKSDVVVFSDSQYVVNSISKGWAKRWRTQNWMRNDEERAENPDLWVRLLELCDRHSVEFRWVKGHNGTKENERCDQLALQAAQQGDLPADEGFENEKPMNSAQLFPATKP
jgi:ribonuclease HI